MRHVLIILSILFASDFALVSCGGKEKPRERFENATLAELLSDSFVNPYESHLDSAPDQNCIRLKNLPIRNLRREFNDSNYIHLEAAAQIGVDIINDINDAWYLKRPLVEISSCEDYYVDKLTHSYPFLVPEAADLLQEIGSRFNDSLAARGGGDYRIKVTSVMRTPATVKKLRRVNRNASDASAHQYGTTFDISYSRFICDSITVNRSFEDLKNLLGQILWDLRNEGRCFVKYERRQSCFHITARENEVSAL